MLVFWKKNEKEEIAARKKAEKEALDRAKAEEEAREAKRQSRKLNFLLTQTELYSHFIGKKIKTHEAEDTPDTAGKSSGGPDVPDGHEELGLDENGEPLPDIDYDDGESRVEAAARLSGRAGGQEASPWRLEANGQTMRRISDVTQPEVLRRLYAQLEIELKLSTTKGARTMKLSIVGPFPSNLLTEFEC
jgi:DNA helicase INO80